MITDQIMPGLTGDQLARTIMEIRPELPIILCTGFSETVTEENALNSGFKGFFLKPVSIRELSSLLKTVLT